MTDKKKIPIVLIYIGRKKLNNIEDEAYKTPVAV